MGEQALRWCAWCRSAVKPAEYDTVDLVADERDRRKAVVTHEFPIDRCPHCGNKTVAELPEQDARPAHCPSVWSKS